MACGPVFGVLLAGMLSCAAIAQDSRPDPARRLHELVDQKIEALRAELHREIDLALGDDSTEFRSMTLREVKELPPKIPPGLTLASAPASEEFNELHRLLPGEARRVEAVAPGSQAERLGILAGDMFLGPIGLSKKHPNYRVIRHNEEVDPAHEPEETASQMVDRMWDDAVRNAMKNGLEAIRTDQTVPESQPVRK